MVIMMEGGSAQIPKHRPLADGSGKRFYAQVPGKSKSEVKGEVQYNSINIKREDHKQDQPEGAKTNRFNRMQDEKVHWFGMNRLVMQPVNAPVKKTRRDRL